MREREETLRKLKSAGKGKSKFAGFLKSAGKKAFVSLQEYNKKQEKKKTARVKPSVSKSTVIKVNGKTIIIKSNKRKKKVEPVQKKTPDFGDVFNPF
ncbi:hypothetical protein KY333_03740 [Candidatus Woesearchaeota archaeon]|nr:hypothetical protein [Candidatus Woesearchaeota archaeon]